MSGFPYGHFQKKNTKQTNKRMKETAFLSQKTVRYKVFTDPLPVPILLIVKAHNLGLTFASKPRSANDEASGNKIGKNK